MSNTKNSLSTERLIELLDWGHELAAELCRLIQKSNEADHSTFVENVIRSYEKTLSVLKMYASNRSNDMMSEDPSKKRKRSLLITKDLSDEESLSKRVDNKMQNLGHEKLFRGKQKICDITCSLPTESSDKDNDSTSSSQDDDEGLSESVDNEMQNIADDKQFRSAEEISDITCSSSTESSDEDSDRTPSSQDDDESLFERVNNEMQNYGHDTQFQGKEKICDITSYLSTESSDKDSDGISSSQDDEESLHESVDNEMQNVGHDKQFGGKDKICDITCSLSTESSNEDSDITLSSQDDEESFFERADNEMQNDGYHILFRGKEKICDITYSLSTESSDKDGDRTLSSQDDDEGLSERVDNEMQNIGDDKQFRSTEEISDITCSLSTESSDEDSDRTSSSQDDDESLFERVDNEMQDYGYDTQFQGKEKICDITSYLSTESSDEDSDRISSSQDDEESLYESVDNEMQNIGHDKQFGGKEKICDITCSLSTESSDEDSDITLSSQDDEESFFERVDNEMQNDGYHILFRGKEKKCDITYSLSTESSGKDSDRTLSSQDDAESLFEGVDNEVQNYGHDMQFQGKEKICDITSYLSTKSSDEDSDRISSSQDDDESLFERVDNEMQNLGHHIQLRGKEKTITCSLSMGSSDEDSDRTSSSHDDDESLFEREDNEMQNPGHNKQFLDKEKISDITCYWP